MNKYYFLFMALPFFTCSKVHAYDREIYQALCALSLDRVHHEAIREYPFAYTIDLEDADLRGADLSDLDLALCTFKNCDFRGANLFNTRFYGSYMVGCSFAGATFFFTDFRYVDMRFASFYDMIGDGAAGCLSDLSGFASALFEGANLSYTNFYNTRVDGIRFDAETKMRGTVFATPKDKGYVFLPEDIKTLKGAFTRVSDLIYHARRVVMWDHGGCHKYHEPKWVKKKQTEVVTGVANPSNDLRRSPHRKVLDRRQTLPRQAPR